MVLVLILSLEWTVLVSPYHHSDESLWRIELKGRNRSLCPGMSRSAEKGKETKPQLAAVSKETFVPVLQRDDRVVGGYLLGGGKTFRHL